MEYSETIKHLHERSACADQGVIWVTGEVTEESASQFLKSFWLLETIHNEITIFINSCGGEWDYGGSAMCQVVRNSECFISTVAVGAACSAAAMLFSCGDRRVMYQTGYLMFHDGSLETDSTVKELQKTSEVIRVMCEMTYKMLDGSSNRPPSYWREKMSEDCYIFAEEALKIGIATEVIGL